MLLVQFRPIMLHPLFYFEVGRRSRVGALEVTTIFCRCPRNNRALAASVFFCLCLLNGCLPLRGEGSLWRVTVSLLTGRLTGRALMAF